jgi:hypothetical protein
VLGIYQRVNPNAATKDVVPLLYLGVALSRCRDKDEEALEVLTQALDTADQTRDKFVKNALWARAELSRLLRRIGRQTEAEGYESEIRQVVPSYCKSAGLNDVALGRGFSVTRTLSSMQSSSCWFQTMQTPIVSTISSPTPRWRISSTESKHSVPHRD